MGMGLPWTFVQWDKMAQRTWNFPHVPSLLILRHIATVFWSWKPLLYARSAVSITRWRGSSVLWRSVVRLLKIKFLDAFWVTN